MPRHDLTLADVDHLNQFADAIDKHLDVPKSAAGLRDLATRIRHQLDLAAIVPRRPHLEPILPLRAAPRDEVEVNGSRVLYDAKNNEVAYVPFDEDAEHLARVANAHPVMIEALRAAKVALLYSSPDHSHYPEPVKRHAGARDAVDKALIAAGVNP